VSEYADAVTDILAVFDDDPQMTEEVTSCDPDQLTAEAAALARIREIARCVLEGRRPPAEDRAHAHDWELVDRQHYAPWTVLGPPLGHTLVLTRCGGCGQLATWDLAGTWELDQLRRPS
jgi:hypothetical protein